MKKIGIVLFEAYHQQRNTASSRIRGHWLIKYWPEAEAFIQGKDYETVIYQKAYWKEHARAFKGKKILDICDPDWLDGIPTAEFMALMHAITVPTEALKEAIEKFTDTPVYVIKDRLDLDTLPPQKKDSGEKAKTAVWFGYHHNIHVLDPALDIIASNGLILKAISNGTLNSGECKIENIRWEPETVNAEIQKADFAILPQPTTGRHRYKSDNKERLAIALGLPVAKTSQDVKRFTDPDEREKEMLEKYPHTPDQWKDFDVRTSVEEMKAVIESIHL